MPCDDHCGPSGYLSVVCYDSSEEQHISFQDLPVIRFTSLYTSANCLIGNEEDLR